MTSLLLPNDLVHLDPLSAHGDDPRSLAGLWEKPWAAYLHVPFCRIRCGYCDFNTYTKDFGFGASKDNYHQAVTQEIALSINYLQNLRERIDLSGVGQSEESLATVDEKTLVGERKWPPPLQSVYFGGGTPTLLAAENLVFLLERLQEQWGIAPGAEVSIEANPDTLTPELVETLAAGGFTRVSIGMQSAVPKVLQILDRTHQPQRIVPAVKMVQSAGMQASLDLIYGTPGESQADWECSLEMAIAAGPDHISAYSLVIEPGTKMGRQQARREILAIDPDQQAEKYRLADQILAKAGYAWYEISNWAKRTSDQTLEVNGFDSTQLATASRHNLAYWRDWNWWGFGPGAHSHLSGVRWWNRKHPLAYAQTLLPAVSMLTEQWKLPIQAGEVVDQSGRELEKLMLAIRTASGVVATGEKQAQEFARLETEGLVQKVTETESRYILTLSGRLLADLVTLRLLEAKD